MWWQNSTAKAVRSQWAPLTAADVEISLPEPSDADLQAHYDASPELYTSLETRVLRYVWLTPDMIQDDMPVDEDELRAEYDARIDEFVQAERRLIERLVFSSGIVKLLGSTPQ